MMNIRRSRSLMVLVIGCALLTACSTPSWLGGKKDKEKLKGERVSILDLQKTLEPDNVALDAQGFVAPTAWRNDFWPQAGGYANHAMQHLALGNNLKEIWTTDIGEGASDSLPLTAQPVVVDGKIFTEDTASQVSAYDAQSGKRLWKISVRDKKEGDEVIGGGLAYSAGKLFITNGFDEVIAVSPDTGKQIWRAPISAPSRAAPTAQDGRVFVMTLDNKLLALSADDGSLIWDYAGLGEMAGLIGAASPAVSRDIVLPAFSSGDIDALRVENGALAWSENLAPTTSIGGSSTIADIRALPVADKGLVFGISYGGKMSAVEERTGNRVWQRDIGGSETPWLAGNSLFVISNDNQLISLGRDTGAIRWITPLPRYKDPASKEGKIFWTGPVFAGNRLIMASTEGDVYEVGPDKGNILKKWKTEGSISIPPVVAGETLYLLTDDAELIAYR